MHVHLMGASPLHRNILHSSLQAAGWQPGEIHTPASLSDLESDLATESGAILVLDLGSAEDTSALGWLFDLTRRWPSLRVVLLSAQRGESLLVQAMRSGVREVLDSPPEPADLVRTLQLLTEQANAVGGHVSPPAPMFAFMASKGGNGSTLLASNLAWVLAAEFRLQSALLDLDLLYGDASFYLGGGQAHHSIDQLLQQGPRLDNQLLRSSLHPVHERLQLLAAPTYPALHSGLSSDALTRALTLLRQQHAVVVLDLPRHLDELTLHALQLADKVFIVMRHTVPDVRNAQRLMDLLLNRGIPSQRLHPLLNREDEPGGLDRSAIEKALPIPISHRIANDPNAMRDCMHLGLPLLTHAPASPVLRDLRLLASQSLNLPMPHRPGWLGRWLGRTVLTTSPEQKGQGT